MAFLKILHDIGEKEMYLFRNKLCACSFYFGRGYSHRDGTNNERRVIGRTVTAILPTAIRPAAGRVKVKNWKSNYP